MFLMSSQSHPCWKCGSCFSTERGLETHVGKMHDPLPKEKAIRLYIQENLSAKEISDRLGISHASVKDRLSKYDLWGKDPVTFHLEDSQGYPVIYGTGDEENGRVRVHRLVAISTGYSPYDVFGGGKDVDHKNNCKVDNRPENIQVLSKQDHGAKHAHQGPKNQYDC